MYQIMKSRIESDSKGRKKVYDTCSEPCSIEKGMRMIGGKWTGSIIYHLKDEPVRFNDLCRMLGGGRTEGEPKKNYGNGGAMTGKKYMLSLTFNAPLESFNDADEYLFQGKSVDDLWFPMHMNFRFFAMEPLETFACYDVMKNPDIENDLIRFKEHLNKTF